MSEVFISYRQTDDAQKNRVREFAERLRAVGINVILDQFFLEENLLVLEVGVGLNQLGISTEVLLIMVLAWMPSLRDERRPGGRVRLLELRRRQRGLARRSLLVLRRLEAC